MKKLIFLFSLFIFLISCSKTDDDTEEICNSDCTILQGRFVTENDSPLKNIELRLDYRISNAPFSASTRIIKKTKTDENGNYEMKFYLEDSEIGNNEGYFALLIDATNLNSDNYINREDIYIGDAIYSLPKRDTIIDKSFYIPTKDFITVNLIGFTPIQNNDYFEVRTLFPSGLKIGENDFLGGEYQTNGSGYGNYSATSDNQKFENVIVARNETNIVRIARRKNGVNTIEDFEVEVPENNSIELTYEY